MPSSSSENIRSSLESRAIEACLTLEEFTLQGMTLGVIFSTAGRDQDEIRMGIVGQSPDHDFDTGSLDQFIGLNLSMLASDSLDLQLLISDEESVHTRMSELSGWAYGFLSAYQDSKPDAEVVEILEDLEAIAEVDLDLDSQERSDGAEPQDRMVEECLEHVRVSMLLLNELKS